VAGRWPRAHDSCLDTCRWPELCRRRRPREPPRAPPPASLYPLSVEAKPHLLSPPREAAIATPQPPMLLHAALTWLPAPSGVTCHPSAGRGRRRLACALPHLTVCLRLYSAAHPRRCSSAALAPLPSRQPPLQPSHLSLHHSPHGVQFPPSCTAAGHRLR
jgi:hypothetical protein